MSIEISKFRCGKSRVWHPVCLFVVFIFTTTILFELEAYYGAIYYSKYSYILLFVYIFILLPVLFIDALLKLDIASLLAYTIILSFIAVNYKFIDDVKSFKTYLRCAFFYSYPHLCPTKVSHDQIVSICHQYKTHEHNPVGYFNHYRIIIAFNQGCELSLPIEKWPKEVGELLGMQIKNEGYSKFKNSRHIIGHVYIVVDVD